MIAESSQMKYKTTTEKLKSPSSNGEFLVSLKSLLMLYLGYGYEDTSHKLVYAITKFKIISNLLDNIQQKPKFMYGLVNGS